jgi:hypothetical protein
MVELLGLGALLMLGALVFAVVGAVFAVLRFVFWLVFLPIRLAFKLLFLPLLLIKWLIVGAVGVLAAPLLLVLFVVGGLALLVAIITPLLPVLFAGFLVWALIHLVRRPATA